MKVIKVSEGVYQKLTQLKEMKKFKSYDETARYLIGLKRDKEMVKEALGEYEAEKRGY